MKPSKARQYSPVKIHKIKRCQKQVQVRIRYSSPPRAQKQQNISKPKDSIQIQTNKKQIKIVSLILKDKRKQRQLDLKPKSKQFYRNKIEESDHAIQHYQQFHKNFAEGKIQKRLKVYSNSKSNKIIAKKYDPVPVKTITIKKKNQPFSPVSNTHKIRLYSSKKLSSRQNPKMSGYNQKQLSKNKLQKQNPITSPFRSRKHKLQVTSSRSRKKNESLMSHQLQVSTQVRRIQLQNWEDKQMSAQVCSFNSQVLH